MEDLSEMTVEELKTLIAQDSVTAIGELVWRFKDDTEFFASTKRDAERGDARAQVQLAYIYVNSTRWENFEEAEKWLKKAADQGYAIAQSNLADIYGGKRGKEDETIALYKKAIAQGRVEAMNGLACFYIYRIFGHLDEAIELLEKAANLGYGEACFGLAVLYEEGVLLQRDPAEAVRWLMRAAESGNSRACVKIAEHYKEGDGVEKNAEESEKWLQKAKESDAKEGWDFLTEKP